MLERINLILPWDNRILQKNRRGYVKRINLITLLPYDSLKEKKTYEYA
jgi:hypothetical protein